ncbi:hypothetical protein IU11_14080, partial [Cellulosimicrobium sp. MM]
MQGDEAGDEHAAQHDGRGTRPVQRVRCRRTDGDERGGPRRERRGDEPEVGHTRTRSRTSSSTAG